MRTVIVIIALCMCSFNYCQNKDKERQKRFRQLDSIKKITQKERDSFLKLNLIDRSYLYLNDDFKIEIDSLSFQNVIKDYPGIVETYKDSLMRILSYELKSTSGGGLAFHRILFNWEKLSYYIWTSEGEAQELGYKLGFKHPYRFYEYLMDDTIYTVGKLKLLNEIKVKLSKVDTNAIEIKPYKKFLRYAFKVNPMRHEAMDAYMKANSKHKHR